MSRWIEHGVNVTSLCLQSGFNRFYKLSFTVLKLLRFSFQNILLDLILTVEAHISETSCMDPDFSLIYLCSATFRLFSQGKVLKMKQLCRLLWLINSNLESINSNEWILYFHRKTLIAYFIYHFISWDLNIFLFQLPQ